MRIKPVTNRIKLNGKNEDNLFPLNTNSYLQ